MVDAEGFVPVYMGISLRSKLCGPERYRTSDLSNVSRTLYH